jgi:membrane protease YdiL (CAAX protease family)
MDNQNKALYGRIGEQLKTNRFYKISEILILLFVVIAFVSCVLPLAGDNPILQQLVLWLANVFMLFYIWMGCKFRGEGWKDFGLSVQYPTWKSALRMVFQSIIVFILAMAGFILGSIIMANITGIPEGSGMNGYSYLQDNIGMLALTLVGVYIVSSFGEEVVYRAFLINRISELGPGGKKGHLIAVIISAIIFGLAHYGWGPMGMVQTGIMGLALGFCYIYLNKRLWALILAHAYMDTILMVQMYLQSN